MLVDLYLYEFVEDHTVLFLHVLIVVSECDIVDNSLCLKFCALELVLDALGHMLNTFSLGILHHLLARFHQLLVRGVVQISAHHVVDCAVF